MYTANYLHPKSSTLVASFPDHPGIYCPHLHDYFGPSCNARAYPCSQTLTRFPIACSTDPFYHETWDEAWEWGLGMGLGQSLWIASGQVVDVHRWTLITSYMCLLPW